MPVTPAPRPRSKLDAPPATGLTSRLTTMLSGCAELISFLDVIDPAPSHPTLFGPWTEERLDEVEVAIEGEVSKEAAAVITALDRFLQRAGATHWRQQPAGERAAHVQHLLSLPQIPQRTADWYAQGKQVLTASEFSTIFKTPRAVSQLVVAKSGVLSAAAAAASPAPTNRLACMSCEMGPFDWGIRFEPVVKAYLERIWGATIAEAGRLLHPTDKRLAASPDGLIVAAADPDRVGRLVEIKCPITREIGGGAPVPFDYWCQMQLQMEVTGIDECEYVEVKIDSIGKQKQALGPDVVPEGHLWLFQDPSGACEMVYAYTETQRDALAAAGKDLIEIIPWRVAHIETRVVARDRAWFDGTATIRAAFWRDVEAARAGSFVPVASLVRKPKVAAKGGPLVLNVIKEGSAAAAAAAAAATPCMISDD
jgi:hypothetical protein